MPHIFIATPEPGTVKTAYMRSIIRTLDDLMRHKITGSFWTETGRHVWHQRNTLAAHFLASDATHLCFVDSDMDFDGSLCRRLLSYEKPMIGAACQLRRDPPIWNVRLGRSQLENGIARCEAIGFGVVMMQRAVIERMTETTTDTYVVEGTEYRDLFGSREEDVAFCRRWRDLGGEIWALLDAKIGHIGDYAYGADQSYLDYLKANGAFKATA